MQFNVKREKLQIKHFMIKKDQEWEIEDFEIEEKEDEWTEVWKKEHKQQTKRCANCVIFLMFLKALWGHLI